MPSRSLLRQPFETLAANAGGTVDRIFIRFAFGGRQAGRRTVRKGAAQKLDELGAFYTAADAEGRLFPTPERADLTEHRVRSLDEGEVVDLAWPSTYEPVHAQYAVTLERVPENGRCVARWFRHDADAPVMICLHGYGGGKFAIEQRAFAAKALYQRGIGVLLVTLPFHGQRASTGGYKAAFPSPNPIRSNEGFAQAVHDLRALVRALRERGKRSVGLSGMSLGGFTSALMATVESDLDFVVPWIPFASLPIMLWEHGRHSAARRRAEVDGIDLERFKSAFTPITPILRAPTIDSSRMLIVVGERDQVTPPKHGRWLHEHFRGSKLISFPGSHLVQIGRRQALRELVKHVLDSPLVRN